MTADHPFVNPESPDYDTWKPIFHASPSKIKKAGGASMLPVSRPLEHTSETLPPFEMTG